MAYASFEDVEDILPPDETLPSESSREGRNLLTALEEATDLVVAFLEREYTGAADADDVPSDVPAAVRRVVARVAMRGFLDEPTNPGAESTVELMGPFSHTINWMKEAQARSHYLTKAEELRLEPYRVGYVGGVAHAPMMGACGDWTLPSYRWP